MKDHSDRYPGLREWPDKLEPSVVDLFFDAVAGRYDGDMEQAVMAGIMTTEYAAGLFLKHGEPDTHPPAEATRVSRRRTLKTNPNAEQCREALKSQLSSGEEEGMKAFDWGSLLVVIGPILQELIAKWLKK